MADRQALTHDVIVVGAGAAGLTVAGGCAMLGLRVALIERGAMGGDCLNTGCVPSKALIAAARAAHDARGAARFGVAAVPEIDFAAVQAHVARTIARIAPDDDAARFTALGCEVIAGPATLTGCDRLRVAGRTLRAKRIVLATGSRPAMPAIDGLDAVPYLSSETVFDLAVLPAHLIVLGGGPIGCEMAQAFVRLGACVTLIARGRILPRDDADAAAVVADALRRDGVAIYDGEAARADRDGEGIALTLTDGRLIAGSHVLIATGRRVDAAGLGLDAAGVGHDARGIAVDRHGRTSNRRIYAIGDCRPGPRFTHVSGYEGAQLVLEIGLGIPRAVDYRALPRVTFCDPELAQIGPTEAEAVARHGRQAIRVARSDFAANDRARTEDATEGFAALICRGRRTIGATIVGRGAGELLAAPALAIGGKASSFAIASATIAYPTRMEALKDAAFKRNESLIFNRLTRGWARLLARLRR